MIELKNINFAYNNKTVLKNLNIRFEANKITCLLGNSGSGKTTILRLIAGLETAQTGEIFIENELVSSKNKILVPPHKRNLGYIFQDLALWPHMSVYKNIAFGLKERKITDFDKKTIEILDFFGISNLKNNYPHQLSGGQKQLVAIARSIVLKPKILLMDEPLSNLDKNLKNKILDYIIKIKNEFNLTIIYVTHDDTETGKIAELTINLM